MRRGSRRKTLPWLAGMTLAVALGMALAGAGSAAPAPTDSANLKIVKRDSPDPVRVGGQLTYAIGVENLGPAPATGVTVTDNLPKSVELVSATMPSGPCAVQGQKATCAIGALIPVSVKYGGSPAAVTIVVVPRKAGTVRNTATVKGDQKDPAGANNKSTAATRVLAAAVCRGIPATIVGTPGSDLLVGTSGPDTVAALGGDDRIVGLSGRDLICAGAAADRVFGGAGRDRLLGRGGPDLLEGASGNDVLKGGRGSDRLRGGSGFDRCRGGGGADSLRGCER